MSDHAILGVQMLQAVDPRFGTLLLIGLGVLSTIGGPLMVMWVVHNDREAAKRATWPGTEGEVVSARVLPFPSRYTSHEVRVSYRYHVNGTEYRSSTVNPMHYDFRGKEAAQGAADRYPAGAKVTVYYDPERPQAAVLQRGTPSSRLSHILLSAAGILCSLLGLVILIDIGVGPR